MDSTMVVPSEKVTVCSFDKSTVPGPRMGTVASMVLTEPFRVSLPMSQVFSTVLVFSRLTFFSTLVHSRLVTLASCKVSGG